MSTRETRADDEGTLPQAQRPTAPVREKPGQLGTIGKGGQAVVRRVRDSKLERDLAMKVLLPQKASNVDAVRRFVDEARITAQLDHPHVPAVHDLSVDDEGSHYFTMKLVEGQTFSAMLSSPDFDITDDESLFRALQILIKVCEGVSFAHSRGVIHCDLKPANVMVGSHGQVYVMDWGISRRLNREAPDGEGAILGTPGYMAPEQAAGAPAKLDTRTDVWALGAMLYRIVVGFPPYHAKDGKEGMKLALGGAVFPAEEQAQGRPMSKRLLEIAMQALSRKPSARHPTVDAFQHELESYVRGSARFPQKTFKKGQVVVREGDPADCAYVVLKGRLRATKKIKGVQRRLGEMGPGELFGEAAILESQPRTATVTALEETKVSVLSRGCLVEEMGRTDVLSLALTSVLQRFHAAERVVPKKAEEAVIFAGAAFLTSIVCFVAGLRAALEARRKRAASKRAAGVVVALNRRVLSTGSAGVYCPTVEFSLPSGEVVRFDSSFGSLPASNSVGDAVQVSYDPASPQTAVIDAWLSHWLGPLVLFGFSVASGLAGLIMLVILIVESK